MGIIPVKPDISRTRNIIFCYGMLFLAIKRLSTAISGDHAGAGETRESLGIDGGGGGGDGDRRFGETHAGGLFHHGQGGGAVIGLAAIETGFAGGLFGFGGGGFHMILCGRGEHDVRL